MASTLAHMASKKSLIDSEWADSLVGLYMCVPDYWWQQYTCLKSSETTIVTTHKSLYFY
jgi:hypothetical protein